MSRMLFAVLLFVLLMTSAFAQDTSSLDFELITSDNAYRLEEIAPWESSGEGYPVADFSPDGRTLVIAQNDGVIQFLSTETLSVVRVIEDVSMSGDKLEFSTDGTRLILSWQDGIYTLWDVASGDVLASADLSSEDVIFEPSSDLQSYYVWHYSNDDMSIHDIITGEEKFRFPSVERFIPSMDGSKAIVSDSAANVLVWDLDREEIVLTLEPFSDEIPSDVGFLHGAGFTPDGDIWTNWQLYSESNGGLSSYSPIQFWDAETGQELFSLEGQHLYHRLYFDPTGRYVAAVGMDAFSLIHSNIWIWDLQTKEPIGLPQGTAGGVVFNFSPSGQLYAYGGGATTTVRVHQIGVDHPLTTLQTTSTDYPLEFSPDGRFLLNVGADTRLWAVKSQP